VEECLIDSRRMLCDQNPARILLPGLSSGMMKSGKPQCGSDQEPPDRGQRTFTDCIRPRASLERCRSSAIGPRLRSDDAWSVRRSTPKPTCRPYEFVKEERLYDTTTCDHRKPPDAG
jgi:hypothetical protein